MNISSAEQRDDGRQKMRVLRTQQQTLSHNICTTVDALTSHGTAQLVRDAISCDETASLATAVHVDVRDSDAQSRMNVHTRLMTTVKPSANLAILVFIRSCFLNLIPLPASTRRRSLSLWLDSTGLPILAALPLPSPPYRYHHRRLRTQAYAPLHPSAVEGRARTHIHTLSPTDDGRIREESFLRLHQNAHFVDLMTSLHPLVLDGNSMREQNKTLTNHARITCFEGKASLLRQSWKRKGRLGVVVIDAAKTQES